MTASAPPEINLPKEAVSHFWASAPPEASLSSEESLAVPPCVLRNHYHPLGLLDLMILT